MCPASSCILCPFSALPAAMSPSVSQSFKTLASCIHQARRVTRTIKSRVRLFHLLMARYMVKREMGRLIKAGLTGNPHTLCWSIQRIWHGSLIAGF